MKTFITFALMMIASTSWGCRDTWGGKDKTLHTVGGCVIQSAVEYCASPYESRGHSRLYGIAFCQVAFFGKELWDSTEPKNHFCFKDIIAGEIGMGISLLTMGAVMPNGRIEVKF